MDPDILVLPKMVIRGERVSAIEFNMTKWNATLRWNGDTFDVIQKHSEFEFRYLTELRALPEDDRPIFKVERLYTAKVSGAVVLALLYTYADGTQYSRLYPYDPIMDRIWNFNINGYPNGTKWCYFQMDDQNPNWVTNDTVSKPPLSWSTQLRQNGLPTTEP